MKQTALSNEKVLSPTGSLVPTSLVVASLWMALGAVITDGKGQENPYLGITYRNGFGIQPPPEPPPAIPVVPPKPPANIALSGIAEFNDGVRAYLVVNRPGNKGPDYLALHEGDRQDDLEVLQIDPVQETVKIRNNGIESTLNFKDNANKSTITTTQPPGIPQPVVPIQQGVQQIQQTFNAPPQAPTVIGRKGEVISGGGNPGYNYAPEAQFQNGGGAVFNSGTPIRQLPQGANQIVTSENSNPQRVIPAPPPKYIGPGNIPLPPIPPVLPGQ